MFTVYRYKPAFQKLFRAIAGNWMTPNMATVFGIVFAAVTGLAFYLGFRVSRWFFLATPPLFVLRLIANVLDGVLAREKGLANQRGEMLNEMCDVVGDCLTYLPTAIAMLEPPLQTMVLLTVVAALLAEFTGVVGKMTTGVRRYEGPMGGKGDRWIWFGLGATILVVFPEAIAYGWQYLAIVLGFVLLTWCNRLRLLWKSL